MNTKTVGERTEGFILARLLQLGLPVSLPFGDNQRYDMIVEEKGKLLRCQCKTARINRGAINFKVCSTNWWNGTRRAYHGEIDLFLAYCPVNQKYYRIPVDACGKNEVTLRLEPSKNGQAKGVRFAVDFEF
jgi:hypothetical protein